jgi:hypothetical protein
VWGYDDELLVEVAEFYILSSYLKDIVDLFTVLSSAECIPSQG